MTGADLVIRNTTVVSPVSRAEVRVRTGHDVVIRDGEIISIDQTGPARDSRSVIDADGRVVMPAFIDAHTHACWAGDRLEEWAQKMSGVPYLELLKRGGGIMSTVNAVRDASREQLAAGVRERLGVMARHGTATVEIKSGYGLTTEHELKMLRAICDAADTWPGTVVPTACIGHAIDPEQPDHVRTTIEETLPAVHAEFPGIAIDAYCEEGAWSLDDTIRLFDRARELGHPVRVHADQFNDLGMIPHAVDVGFGAGFHSVDHLEATTPDHLRLLAGSDVHAVMLPCSGFHVDRRYADGRGFIDAGGTLTLATNANPGSSPVLAIPMAMALGVRRCGLTPDEALCAVTRNPAGLLGLDDRGEVAEGMRADLIVLRHHDFRGLSFEFGTNPVDRTIIAGVPV